MFGYRKILPVPGFIGEGNDPGEPPLQIWVTLDQLVVNEDYQRDLSKQAMKAICKMAQTWDWGKFTSPNVAPTDYEGVYELVDGQRTAIAAATNGKIEKIPVLLSKANLLKDKASNFIGINNSRIPLTRAAIFTAELAAQDETAISVECALSETGARILTVPPTKNIFKVGDTMAIGALKNIVLSKNADRLKRLLSVAVGGEAAPISANLLKALNLCLPNEEDPELDKVLTKYLKDQGVDRLDVLAKNMTSAGKRSFETLSDMLSDRLKIPKRAGVSNKMYRKK